VNTQIAAQGEPDDGTGQAELQLKGAQASHEADLKERQFEHDRQVDFMDMGLRREEMANNIQLKQQDMAEKRDMQRVEQARMAAAAVERPTAQTGAPK
jgi:hypothetical protein